MIGQPASEARIRLIAENNLPIVPNDWAVERFRFLFSESKERNGAGPVGCMLSVSEYQGVVPKEYEHDEQRRTEDELQTYRVVRPGQLAVNTMWLNHLGLGVSDHLGHVSPAYAVYDISKRLDRQFVHHLLRSNCYLEIYKKYLYGIRPNSFQIKNNDWLSIPVLIPPLKLQKIIASFLDCETARIDQLIEKKERQVEVLEEQARVIALRVLSNGLSGIEWSTTSQSMTFRLSNAGWVEMTLSSAVRFMTSGSRGWSDFLSSEGEVFIQSGDIGRHMEVDFGRAQRIQPQSGAEAQRTLIKDSDVLICITGGRTGAVGYVQSVQERAYINQHICLLRAQPNIIIPEFLAHVLWSVIGQKQIEMRQYGVKQGLGFNEVAGIRLPVPPRDQQPALLNRIKSDVARITMAISKVRQSIAVLREHRSALITAVVTGQVDADAWRNRGEKERSMDAAQERLT